MFLPKVFLPPDRASDTPWQGTGRGAQAEPFGSHLWVATTWRSGVLLASGGSRPGMLLNILQCTGWPRHKGLSDSKCRRCPGGETPAEPIHTSVCASPEAASNSSWTLRAWDRENKTRILSERKRWVLGGQPTVPVSDLRGTASGLCVVTLEMVQ